MAPATTTTTATTAAATLFQRNRQLYVDEEDKLQRIAADDAFLQTFQNWLDASIAQLDRQYERCEQQLAELQQGVAVQEGSYWCTKTIIEHCNLHMSERRLLARHDVLDSDDKHVQLPDLIHLIATLQSIKGHSFLTPAQRHFVEQCEQELKSVTFEPRDLAFITNALQVKLRDDGNTRGVFGDLTSFQNAIEDVAPDVEQCEQLLEASIRNGEMQLAEDISKRQLEIYEHILRLITDQYPIIANYYAESRDSDRRRRWAIFRMADKDISAVIESKYRQVEACEEDLVKIKEQMENYHGDDVQQRKRYEADRRESDTYLQQNKEKQQGVWNRVFALYEELQRCAGELATLARDRRREIDRRLQVEEREAGRRSGHAAFLHAAAAHAQRLQDTIANAVAAKELAESLNRFVLDGCDSIAAKYDKQQNALSDMLRLVQQHHFKRFSDYYIAASRYLYRKERKLEQIEAEMTANAMQRELRADALDPAAKGYAEANKTLALRRREVAHEVLYIRNKLEKAELAVAPTLRSLDFAGIAYVHPRVMVAQMNLHRWTTMLDYREATDASVPPLARQCAEEQAALAKLRAQLDREGGGSLEHGGGGNGSTSASAAPRARAAAAARGKTTASSAAAHASPVVREATALLDKPLPGQAATRGGGDGDGDVVAARLRSSSGGSSSSNNGSSHGARSHTPGTTATAAAAAGTRANVVRAAAMTSATGHAATMPPRTSPPQRLSTSAAGASAAAAAATATSSSSSLLLPSSRAGTAASQGTHKEDGNSHSHSSGSGGGRGGLHTRTPPAQMEGATFRVLYAYKSRAPDELTLEAGDRVVCVSRTPEEGWFRGICNQRTGLFPINYVAAAYDDDEDDGEGGGGDGSSSKQRV